MPLHPSSPAPDASYEHAWDRRAAWFLDGPLTTILAFLCVVQFAVWVPGYLVWPLWADHDVFGTAALSWDRGVAPYRDFYCNNFPGTIYLFWVLGKVFGWGKPPAFYAVDAALVAVLGALLVTWSRRCFNRALAGLAGFATFLAYYLTLDYSQAAQRDWQGPFFAVAALLILQAWAGNRSARWISAGVFAVGMAMRPQVALFLPAIVASIGERSQTVAPEKPNDGRLRVRFVLALLEWIVACGLAVLLLASPLIAAGSFGDFLGSIRRVGPGSPYSQITLGQFNERMLSQILPLKFWLVPFLIVFLGGFARPRRGDHAGAWLLALTCVLLYRPMSRMPHAYLAHPLALTSAVLVAILVARLSSWSYVPAAARLTAILLVLGLNVSLKPRFSNPNGARLAIDALRGGSEPALCPPGYTHNPEVPASARYDWSNYRDLLGYLRSSTSPDTPVANALKFVPAINSSVARTSSFPAESIAWLIIMGNQDEAAFAESLRRSQNAVVVWAPSEKDVPGLIKIPALTNVIEELYELERRFGPIEVWRRKAKPSGKL